MKLGDIDKCGVIEIAKIQSNSDKDKKYSVTRKNEIVLSELTSPKHYQCECISWQRGRDKRKAEGCTHIRKLMFRLTILSKLMEFQRKGFIHFESEGTLDNTITAICNVRENWK